MSDKLDLFIESQKQTNERITQTLDTLADTVNRLEKDAVRYESLENRVTKTEAHQEKTDAALLEFAKGFEFVKNAKQVYIAILTAMILAGGGVLWQSVSSSSNEEATQKLLLELVKEIKASRSKTQAHRND